LARAHRAVRTPPACFSTSRVRCSPEACVPRSAGALQMFLKPEV